VGEQHRRAQVDVERAVDLLGREGVQLAAPGQPGIGDQHVDLADGSDQAVDVAALGEADVVRLQRRLDTLEQRLLTIERRPTVRIVSKLRGAAKKLRRR
jgi:hypothetical protein